MNDAAHQGEYKSNSHYLRGYKFMDYYIKLVRIQYGYAKIRQDEGFILIQFTVPIPKQRLERSVKQGEKDKK